MLFKMLVLGIETSCDETCAAVVKDGREILSNVVASQVEFHRRFGGVVPEIASRKHLELIIPVIEEALTQAKVTLKDIEAVGVTRGPGLMGSLMVGITVAKGIGFAQGIPLVGINHLEAHLYAAFLSSPPLSFPFLGLVASGGHTDLIYVSSPLKWELLGSTRDDAAGEAFDKVARILGLGYPGGPKIEEAAKKGNPEEEKFPSPSFKKGGFDFSFSGIKTSVLYRVREIKEKGGEVPVANIAAGFQKRVCEILTHRLFEVVRIKKVKTVVLGGGVISNGFLRKLLGERKPEGVTLHIPPPSLCTDNAAMVGSCAYFKLKKGEISPLTLEPEPTLRRKET